MIDEKRNAAPSPIRFGTVHVGSFTYSEKSFRGHLGDSTSLLCVYYIYIYILRIPEGLPETAGYCILSKTI